MTQPMPQPRSRPTNHALRAYRDRHGLTQRALAKSLGVSSITVSRWETGARKIDDELLALVAQKTGIPRGALRPDLAALLQPSAPGQP